MSLELISAYDHPQVVRELFQEYTQVVIDHEPSFAQYLEQQHFDQELAHLELKYGLPEGRLYLARWDGNWAGCCALRKIEGDICEIKRLYVRPQFRGHRIGQALSQQIIDDARKIGYHYMRLDTFHFLKSAIRTYREMGFYDIPQYNDSPMADAVYLEFSL